MEDFFDIYAICLNNLAISYKNEDDFTKAIEYGEKAKDYITKIYRKEKKDRSFASLRKYYTNLSNYYYLDNSIEKAIDIISDLINFEQSKDINYAVILTTLSQYYSVNNNTERALELTLEANEIVEEYFNSDTKKWFTAYVTNLNYLVNEYMQNGNIKEGQYTYVKLIDLLKDKCDLTQASSTKIMLSSMVKNEGDEWNMLCYSTKAKEEKFPKLNIYYLIEKNMISHLKNFIECGVNLDSRNSYSETPLMFASRINKIEIVKLLLENGANINAEDDFCLNSLSLAVKPNLPGKNNGNVEIVIELLNYGVKMFEQDYSRLTSNADQYQDKHILLILNIFNNIELFKILKEEINLDDFTNVSILVKSVIKLHLDNEKLDLHNDAYQTANSIVHNTDTNYTEQTENKYDEPFSTLLKIAKGIAILYGSEEITANILFNSLSWVELNQTTEDIFRQIYGKHMDQMDEKSSGHELIVLAKRNPKIKYSEEIENLIKKLKSNLGDEKILRLRSKE